MIELTCLVDAPGASSLPYVDPAFPDRPLVLHAARPREYDTETPVLFVHHGVGCNGEDYRDYWLELVDEIGVLAISIEFPEASFPEYLWYHFGNLHTKDGVLNPREAWTFGIDARLFEQLRAQSITTRQRYGLFGHSAGGQFVHRMLSFGFRDRVAVAVSANAGAGFGDTMAVWPGRDGRRYRRTARAAGLSDHRNGRHWRRHHHGSFLPKGPAFYAPGCEPL
jgi:hypothetical protein